MKESIKNIIISISIIIIAILISLFFINNSNTSLNNKKSKEIGIGSRTININILDNKILCEDVILFNMHSREELKYKFFQEYDYLNNTKLYINNSDNFYSTSLKMDLLKGYINIDKRLLNGLKITDKNVSIKLTYELDLDYITRYTNTDVLPLYMDLENIDYLNNLNKDKASSFVGATSSDILIKKNIDAKVSDTSWIDMVEECIPYLDNIIRNPRRFIVQEENIVPIEKAKVVTEESIRHLAQHTSMIQEVQEDGTVIPLKLLNVYREETVDLYENRFIKSLVDNLYTFVNNKLNESDQRSYAKVVSDVTYSGRMKRKDEEVEINLSLKSKKTTEVDASKDGHSLDERIEHIRDIVTSFRGSAFIKSLKESSPVRSPIRKTNVILKEQNFIKALELWEYLEKNNIKPVTSIEKRNEVSKSNDVKTLYDLAFFINSDALDNETKAKYDLAFFIDNDAIEIKDKAKKEEFNSAIVSKLVNDFVFGGDITEREFKKLMEKEFKEANKRKEKATSGIKKCIETFLDDVDKKKKKMVTIIK